MAFRIVEHDDPNKLVELIKYASKVSDKASDFLYEPQIDLGGLLIHDGDLTYLERNETVWEHSWTENKLALFKEGTSHFTVIVDGDLVANFLMPEGCYHLFVTGDLTCNFLFTGGEFSWTSIGGDVRSNVATHMSYNDTETIIDGTIYTPFLLRDSDHSLRCTLHKNTLLSNQAQYNDTIIPAELKPEYFKDDGEPDLGKLYPALMKDPSEPFKISWDEMLEKYSMARSPAVFESEKEPKLYLTVDKIEVTSGPITPEITSRYTSSFMDDDTAIDALQKMNVTSFIEFKGNLSVENSLDNAFIEKQLSIANVDKNNVLVIVNGDLKVEKDVKTDYNILFEGDVSCRNFHAGNSFNIFLGMVTATHTFKIDNKVEQAYFPKYGSKLLRHESHRNARS